MTPHHPARRAFMFTPSSLAVFVAAFGVAIMAPSAAAQQEDAAGQVENNLGSESPRFDYKHVLNGHAFLPSLVNAPPFADSQAMVNIAGGTGTYDYRPIIPAVGGPMSLKLGVLSPIIQGQVAFLDRFAVHLGLTSVTIAGLNTESALAYGASTSYAFNVGALWEFLREDKVSAAVALRVDRPHSYTISPIDAAVEAIRDQISGLGANFIDSRYETQYRPNVRLAYAPEPYLGVRFNLGFLFNTVFAEAESSSRNRLNVGAGIEGDLRPLISVPIGLSANYLRGQSISSGVSSVDTFSFGLFETFGRPFNFGIEGGWTQINQVKAGLGIVTLRAYYN